jgi:hypothetical protein
MDGRGAVHPVERRDQSAGATQYSQRAWVWDFGPSLDPPSSLVWGRYVYGRMVMNWAKLVGSRVVMVCLVSLLSCMRYVCSLSGGLHYGADTVATGELPLELHGWVGMVRRDGPRTLAP